MNRRRFLGSSAAAALAASFAPRVFARSSYTGPSVIVVRFGGGTRRQETLIPENTYSPYFLHEMAKHGVLLPNMEISQIEDLQTSHGEGTLNILTGKYDRYQDVGDRFLGSRFEARVPTLFEYLRKEFFGIAPHETLLINGEDRIEEEFYTFSSHADYGYDYRARVLSLYRYKTHLLRRQLADTKLSDKQRRKKKQQLKKMVNLDFRGRTERDATLERFWDGWRDHYGDSGFVNPRGDRLLTELTLWAMRELRPRLMMVNYNDCDYVHWGNKSHYTRGIQIMDEGLKRIVEATQADPFYRDNTIFAVVPDCGRDDNRYMAVPYQHHFNTDSARKIFALFSGPGVAKGRRIDRTVQQIDVAPTVAALMGMRTPHAEGSVVQEVIA